MTVNLSVLENMEKEAILIKKKGQDLKENG